MVGWIGGLEGGLFAVMDGAFEGEELIFGLVRLDWHVAGEVGGHGFVRIAVIDSIGAN